MKKCRAKLATLPVWMPAYRTRRQRLCGQVLLSWSNKVASFISRAGKTAAAACAVWMQWALAASAVQPSLVELQQQAIAAAVAHVAPSVVRIETIGGLERVEDLIVPTGPTTGLIISEDGYIVSSAFNFVQKPSSILVTLHDGARHAARIVAHDHSRMLVLLKIDAEAPLPIPEPAPRESWKVGQWAIAVGRTFAGSLPNVSVGILSATNRVWGKAVQTDAKVSPSNYGGPLVDIEGRVIGVLVPISPHAQGEIAGAEWYDSGIGFAIPLVDVLARLDQWKQGRDLHAGLLGIAFEDKNELLGRPVISVVRFNSPAQKAGLQPKDRITHINGVPVVRIAEVKHQLGPLYAGDTVTVTVDRNGQPVTVSATLVDQLVPYAHARLGVLPRTPADQQPGVEIAWLLPGGAAEKAGLQQADRIRRCAGQEITDTQSLGQVLLAHQPGDRVTLDVQRGRQRLSVEVQLQPFPEKIPDGVPVIEPPEGGQEAWADVAVPEEPNQCRLWLPYGANPPAPYGLLVWLQAGGQYDAEAVVAAWKEQCRSHGVALLLPRSADPTGWRPTDVEYLRKVLSHVIENYPIDRQKVVIGGEELGGSIAYVVAFGARAEVRGLLVRNAAAPVRLRIPDNEPAYPLAVFLGVAQHSRLRAAVGRTAEQLRAMRYPTVLHLLGSADGTFSQDDMDLAVRWMTLLALL
ncbi:MAG: type I deoxyribonuclease HsdR [Pirellulaceae bacterium]|nr:MAG: type I deoxyribonuclease HsdR [Pirellulaceae bacterium]